MSLTDCVLACVTTCKGAASKLRRGCVRGTEAATQKCASIFTCRDIADEVHTHTHTQRRTDMTRFVKTGELRAGDSSSQTKRKVKDNERSEQTKRGGKWKVERSEEGGGIPTVKPNLRECKAAAKQHFHAAASLRSSECDPRRHATPRDAHVIQNGG